MTATPQTAMARHDDVATLIALGIAAYALETMVHEGLGHGSLCFADGGRITRLTPLWMQCSTFSTAMEAAGPAANIVATIVFWALLRLDIFKRGTTLFFLWLSFAFNGLVAAGYLGVGGAAAFGDWAFLLSGIHPAWAWRVGAVAVSAGSYYLVLRALGFAYGRMAGGAKGLGRRATIASVGAFIVTVCAQLYGQGLAPSGLILPLASTLGPGLSLWGARDFAAAGGKAQGPSFAIERCWLCQGFALALSLFYVLALGPGITL